MQFRPGALLSVCIAVVLGVLQAGLLLGWRRIDPSNLSWLNGDLAQYQTGWEFLRRQTWTFPPTWLTHLDYPLGISAAYLDVIPVVAVPLRLFAGVLPSEFQYLGTYAAVCLILQAYFGMKLLSCFTTDKVLMVLGALFFLNAPILLFRLYAGHFSLCSQWLIVAAIYCYFRPAERSNLATYLTPFIWLTAIAGGVTPYIAVMVLLIGLAALLRACLERSTAAAAPADVRNPSGARLQRLLTNNHALWAAILAGSTAISFVFFGFVVFGGGPALADKGYGMFSMNLVSPVAPLGLSFFPSPFRVFTNQNEGYNYLGMGLALLGVISLVRYRTSIWKLWAPSLRPLVIVSMLLTLLALSVRLTAGQTVLFIFPVPLRLFQMLAVFRSSGRLFWPVWYLLMIGAIVGGALTIPGRWSRRAVLTTALGLQIIDLLPLGAALAERSSIVPTNPLRALEWKTTLPKYRHLIILPARQCDAALTPSGAESWPFFAWFAARNGLTLNSVYAARISNASQALNCSVLPQDVAAGNINNDTAYLLSDRIADLATAQAHALHCRRVDGFNLCTAVDEPPRRPRSEARPASRIKDTSG